MRGPVPVSPLRAAPGGAPGGAGRLPFWVDLIFKSAFQKLESRLGALQLEVDDRGIK